MKDEAMARTCLVCEYLSSKIQRPFEVWKLIRRNGPEGLVFAYCKAFVGVLRNLGIWR